MKLVEKIETIIIYILITMLLISVILGTVQLGIALINIILKPPFLRIDPEALFLSYGLFLIIIIGLELLKLLKARLLHHDLRPETVIEVAIIAVCNKVVTLNLKALEGLTLIGMSALILALSAAYYIFIRTRQNEERNE